jgi:MinD superfamily P-loop ATPase
MKEIAIISGKGGTGKTVISAAFATIEKNIVVADCDVDAANLYLILLPVDYHSEKFLTGYKAVIDYNTCTNCGKCVSYCRFGAISNLNEKVVISETDCDGCMLCSRICPSASVSMVKSDNSYWYTGDFRNGKMVHARLAPGEENSGKLVNVVREQARELFKETGSDTIIIDGPPGTGCPAISSVTGVSKAVIVTEPTSSGFHDMKRVLELTAGFKITSFIVINKYDLNVEVTDQIIDWCQSNDYRVIGKLPFDPGVIDAMLNCKSIIEWMPDSEISIKIKSIYRNIMDN